MPDCVRRRLLCAFTVTAVALASPALAGGDLVQHKRGGGASYVQMPAINATVIRRSGDYGVLTVEVGLDAPDPAIRERASLSAPRLRDAYARFLVLYGRSLPPGGSPNPELVGTQLQRATDRVLGKPGARVLLGSVVLN